MQAAVGEIAGLLLKALSLVGKPGLTRINPLERHMRDVLCGRVHSPQTDSVLGNAGRLALGLA